MLDLRQIEVFRSVYALGSVTKAARFLNISQPAVSRMLAHMEDRLGFRLFERAGGRLTATDEARQLYAEAELAYRQVEQVRSLAAELRLGRGASVRLAVNPSLSFSVAPLAIARVRTGRPELRFEVDVQPSTTVAELIAREQADIAAVLLPLHHPAVHTAPIGSADVVCIMPPEHRLAGHEVVSPSDLADEPLVSFGADTAQGMALDEVFEAAGVVRDVRIKVRFAHTAANFVAHGVGVALVDAFSLHEALAARLTVRPFEPAIRFRAYAAWNAFRPKPCFADELIAAMRDVVRSRSILAEH